METCGTGARADAGAERVVASDVVVDEDGVVGDGWCEAVEDLCVFRRWGCGAKVTQDADETFETICATFRMRLMVWGRRTYPPSQVRISRIRGLVLVRYVR